MTVKKFTAKNMPEALRLVREQLGPDAAVLQTRELPNAGWLRWLHPRQRFEVTAANQSATIRAGGQQSTAIQNNEMSGTARQTSRLSVAANYGVQIDNDGPSARENDQRRASSSSKKKSCDDLRQQLSGLQSLVTQMRTASDLHEGKDFPPSLAAAYARLTRADVPHLLARQLIERVRDALPPDELDDTAQIDARTRMILEGEIRTSGDICPSGGQSRVVVLVGPSGVGKTTTVAKLAADFRLRKQRSVGLIAVDNGRVAAADQLQAYAEIIDLPIETANTPGEMRRALERLRHRELIFVDTASVSLQDEVKLQEFKSLLAVAEPNEVHLVLSGVAAANHALQSVELFSETGVTALILTKLDEASSLGHLLPVLMSGRLPISYLSSGQNVPDDFQVADSCEVARRILGSSVGCVVNE